MTCNNWPLLEEKDVPSYVQIYDIVFQLIQKGELREGDSLPGENFLAVHWNVSRSTVRMAVRKLEEDGYLYKMQGKRTTVASRTSLFDNGLQWLFNPCVNNCVTPITHMCVEKSTQMSGAYVADKIGYKEIGFPLGKIRAGYYVGEQKVAATFFLFHEDMMERWGLSEPNEDQLKEFVSGRIYQRAMRSRMELTAMTMEEDMEDGVEGKNIIVMEEILIGDNDEPIVYCKHRMNANWYRFTVDRKQM